MSVQVGDQLDVGVSGDAAPTLLAISGLTVGFGGRHGARVLDGVNLTVRRGEILGVIGETGSGKTTLARAVVGLAPAESGRIVFEGEEISGLRGRALRAFRRSGRIQFAFQDPLRALDPDLEVRELIGEPLAITGSVGREERDRRVAAVVEDVGLPEGLLRRLPAQLSGGQRQRVLLARALVAEPSLLLCDEPVSALDAASRNHVLALLAGLRVRRDVAVAVISHDLYSLAGIADRIAVLHGGRIVEHGPVREVLENPRNAYTERLVAAAPRLRREGVAPAARVEAA
jgi:ABC-type glutathione transport system ATPase component